MNKALEVFDHLNLGFKDLRHSSISSIALLAMRDPEVGILKGYNILLTTH